MGQEGAEGQVEEADSIIHIKICILREGHRYVWAVLHKFLRLWVYTQFFNVRDT